MKAWNGVRMVTVLGALLLTALLVLDQRTGLRILWRVVVPLLPLTFLAAPGVWRNACPLAAASQVPRLLRFTRGRAAPDWFRAWGPVAGAVSFFVLVATRRVLFDASGPASAALLGGALAGAFTGGILLKGKSGWCSSICPLLSVQRAYGRTPFVQSANSHCQPCLGCTAHCYDVNPRAAWIADLHAGDRRQALLRRLFAGALPGAVVAYNVLPRGWTALELYAGFAACMAAGAASLLAAERSTALGPDRLTALYGAAAFALFYWWGAAVLAQSLGAARPELTWTGRALAVGLSAAWLVRTWRPDAAPPPVRMTSSSQAAPPVRHEITFEPAGLCVTAEDGATLLELAERSDQPVEAGCRLGLCGSDPVCVLNGAEHLSPIGEQERATLERLGLPDGTRLACCARVAGPVGVALEPGRRAAPVPAPRVRFRRDPSVARVVVIGNGIAGVTAADHVRRRHPDCRIDVVAGEGHPLYNRMGISRLIDGRSEMSGLQLLSDAWDEANEVASWLGTRAVAIDREEGEVELAFGGRLPYDRLILATGSTPHVPPIPGYGAPGTFVLREAADALAIRSFAERHSSRRAVVAGGGLLGLEAAYALHELGLEVTVLERGDRLLRRNIDRRAAELLHAHIEGLGINVRLEAEAVAVNASGGRLRGVELNGSAPLEADVFLVAAGIVPNVSLARDAGLQVRRGVVVDDRLRTSDPHILAAGDVAEHRGEVCGLWPAAVAQAEAAAENAVGGARDYEGTVSLVILKVAGIDLVSIGRVEAVPGEEAIVLDEAATGRYRKLVVADGRLVGAVLAGSSHEAAAVAKAIEDRRPVHGDLAALRAGRWDVLTRPAAPPPRSPRERVRVVRRHMPPRPTDLPAGTTFAGCRVETVVGRGGMGVVYRAVQLDGNRPVALKVLAPEHAADDRHRLRFARELEVVAGLRHPHIVPVHDAGECEGHLYLVMAYVEGEDLRARLRRSGWLEPIAAADVVVQTAEALTELHSRGLVHRDVKPANILIAREGAHVYLSDFGLAKEAADARALTRSGDWVGTYDYVAPEQIRGGRIDGRADIYALGCVLFEALTGQVPFERADSVARLWAHIHSTPRPIFPGSCSPFDEVIARAMAKRPQDRFASAAEMGRAALAAAARAYVFAAPPRSGPTRAVTVLERPALAAATEVGRYRA